MDMATSNISRSSIDRDIFGVYRNSPRDLAQMSNEEWTKFASSKRTSAADQQAYATEYARRAGSPQAPTPTPRPDFKGGSPATPRGGAPQGNIGPAFGGGTKEYFDAGWGSTVDGRSGTTDEEQRQFAIERKKNDRSNRGWKWGDYARAVSNINDDSSWYSTTNSLGDTEYFHKQMGQWQSFDPNNTGTMERLGEMTTTGESRERIGDDEWRDVFAQGYKDYHNITADFLLQQGTFNPFEEQKASTLDSGGGGGGSSGSSFSRTLSGSPTEERPPFQLPQFQFHMPQQTPFQMPGPRSQGLNLGRQARDNPVSRLLNLYSEDAQKFRNIHQGLYGEEGGNILPSHYLQNLTSLG
jgi:hypothetical protein